MHFSSAARAYQYKLVECNASVCLCVFLGLNRVAQIVTAAKTCDLSYTDLLMNPDRNTKTRSP